MNEYIKWLAVIGTTFVVTSLAWAGYGMLTEEPEPECWDYGSWLAGCDDYVIVITTRLNRTGIQPDEVRMNFKVISEDNVTGTYCKIYIWR